MEDYRLEQSGQQVQDILNGAAMQVDLTSEVERATEAENILDGKIDAEEERAKVAEKANADDIDAIEEKIPSGASSSNKLATSSDVNDEAQARSDADQTINDKIDTIEAKIPTGASSENKLATEEYVDDSVATNTATFRGTYNLVSDLGLLPSATHEQIAYALGGEIATVDNNDYCFVQIPTSSETPTQITKIERYKFNGDAWAFEYTLNNSGFTAAQWAAINSGITSGDVTKLSALPTNAELTTLLNGKQDTLTFDNAPTENSNNPVKSGGVYSGIKAEEERAKAAEKANADDIDAIEEKIPSGASSSNKLATASDVTGEAAARENADASLQQAIEAILLLIPSAATSLNQLADKAFVNSSIATNTATFRGTFNSVSDLHLSISATHEQIGTMLASSIATADNNDYAFVQIPTSAHRPTEIARTERYKFNGTTWEYEYDLNNSGYTTAQWAAINSTITQELVTKLSALPNNDDLTTALSVLTDSISAINAKIPSAASSDNKLVDTTAMQTYIAQLLDVLDANYNVTSTDGHVTVQITQTNGKVTDFAVTTSDIASAADLELIAGRVTTAEGNISTNAEDIAQLQAAYAALTQNDLVIIQPTDTWPVANPAENIIYRVVDRVNTPPEYYSDYMWNGTTMVLMAQYNNAIDPRPKKGSTNLVESGGVFNNMGALDVSELNATENPHTLATYADLSAALAAIPSDYQKGGMSIKFVQSSDNKYVQFRLMSDTFSTTVTDWQGVDVEPNYGSINLVESGGVEKELQLIRGRNSLVLQENDFHLGVWYDDGVPQEPNVNRLVTNLYLINEGSIINYTLLVGGSTYMICTYDGSGNLVFSGCKNGGAASPYTVPKGLGIKYIQFCSYPTDSSYSPSIQLPVFDGIVGDIEKEIGDTKLELLDKTKPTAQSLFSESEIESGKFINTDGSIADGIATYHLVKFDITTEGDYVISTRGSLRPILAKFENADYSGNGTILISDHIYDVFQKIHLTVGHYAMSWNDDYGTIKDNYVSNSPALLDIFKEPLGMKNNAFVALGIDDIDVAGSSSKTDSVITLNGGGYSNRAYLNKKFECAKKQISGTFKTSGTPDIIIGFVNDNYLHIWNENNKCVSELYNSNGTPIQSNTKYEYDFELQSDVAYQVTVAFDDADAYGSMSISITDEYGNSESHSWDLLIDPSFNETIYFASESITTLTSPTITNQHYYDVRNVKAAIFGHSFVEAWTLRPQRQNSFANLIGQALGRDVFMIYGFGGDTVSGINQNILTCRDFISNAEYVLLCVGVNDWNLTAQEYESNLLTVIGNLQDMNITPILFTIEPNADGYASQVFPTINDWIRNSGYLYVDMDKVFHNADGTINTSLYVGDNIHPNAEGHLRIFNRVKFDCPFLF